MRELTSSERKQLKALAHHLDPVCFVGKNGLTDAVADAVEVALDSRELVKVKFVACKDEKRPLSEALARRTSSHRVGLVGHIAILYREHPDEEKRKIALKT